MKYNGLDLDYNRVLYRGKWIHLSDFIEGVLSGKIRKDTQLTDMDASGTMVDNSAAEPST